MSFPAQIGRYQIKSELGRGGMATVYRAYDPSFDREVAVKVLPREMMHDPQFRARFEREIKMVAGLEHPSIVPVYDAGEEDGQPYFVMRFMTGGSLSDLIASGKVPIEDTAQIIDKIARGLAYAHKKGVIHRDLKPDNILFDNDGSPFISDFGIAKLTQSTGSLTGSGVIGTPAYMSPEQAQGNDIDGRSDLYGLGVIVYQMLSGQQPYNADTPMGVVVKHITEPVPEILNMIPSLPLEVDQIIKLSMAKDRNKRYATVIEMAKALNMVAFGNEGNFTSGNTTALRSGIHKKNAQFPPAKIGFAAAGGILLFVVLGFFLLRNQLFAPQAIAPTPSSSPAPTVTSTHLPTKIPTALPSATPQPQAESAVPFAPACPIEALAPTPIIKATNKLCVDKKPYTVVALPQDATFESLNPQMSCILERVDNGKNMISCAGQELFSYDLKVCLPAAASTADLGKCDPGTTFDSVNQCCQPDPPSGAGCTIFKVDLGACQ